MSGIFPGIPVSYRRLNQFRFRSAKKAPSTNTGTQSSTTDGFDGDGDEKNGIPRNESALNPLLTSLDTQMRALLGILQRAFHSVDSRYGMRSHSAIGRLGNSRILRETIAAGPSKELHDSSDRLTFALASKVQQLHDLIKGHQF